MSQPIPVKFVATDLDAISQIDGAIAIFVSPEGVMDQLARRVNKLSRGAVKRAIGSAAFQDAQLGAFIKINFAAGMNADCLFVCKVSKRISVEHARNAGALMAASLKFGNLTLLTGNHPKSAEIALGFVLRSYTFTSHKTDPASDARQVTVMVNAPERADAAYFSLAAQAQGVFFTRDLTNEPANILTTMELANRLAELSKIGLKVRILEEPELEDLGMHTLLAVGQGSASPSKVVILEWHGGGDEPPFALVGKGVVFDTGGISLKPAGGMEDMTMDMGGAGVVAGVMKTLALRKAKANVIGLVGLVENMPDGLAQRPGDVVKTMKGDTVEVINTDAEGRLVLCDVLWYTQREFAPSAIVDLATLTGAAIIALGHENAAVFSNNDGFVKKFLKAADAENEGAWHMPLGKGYAKQLESRIADVKNVGGRPAGSITAAQFLNRFVDKDMPWIHLDIAGVASRSSATQLAPKGATGWGVRALDRLVADMFEQQT